MDCTIVDVFAESPFAGNQLAVVRDCAHLGTQAMQAIAREMNFSETTFVVAERERDADVRIFTPVTELPFAGHPTLGTAWVLAAAKRERYTLNLPIGSVPVSFEDGLAWLEAPPVDLGEPVPPRAAAAVLDLAIDDLANAFPSRFAAVGPRFALIGVRSLAALRRAKPVTAIHEQLAQGDFLGIFAFANEPYSPDADFAARMFFDAGGWREDPATGSANAAFAAYLATRGRSGAVTVEQGFEMLRPSRIHLDIGPSGNAYRVGGKVQPVLSGRFA